MKNAVWLIGVLGAVSLPLLGAPASSRREALPPEAAHAQSDAGSEFVISVWKTGEGLPVNDIQELRDTPDGYLWLGTHHGLVRFDGDRFETFLRTPTGARYGTRIGPLEVDGQGRLWLAPDEVGLIYLDSGGFTDVLTNGAFLRARAESLCSDGTNGILWVDAEGGLGRVSTEQPNRAARLAGNASGASRWVRDFDGPALADKPPGLAALSGGEVAAGRCAGESIFGGGAAAGRGLVGRARWQAAVYHGGWFDGRGGRLSVAGAVSG